MTDIDVTARFPEIELIENDDIRRMTRKAVEDLFPDYFWTAPAASSYHHHNPYCCDKHGLWIHTKMVYVSYHRTVDSYLVQGRISEFEADCGRAAIILHDMVKYGRTYEDGDSAKEDHDLRAGKLIRLKTDLPEPVADAIERHMGPFEPYLGPDPETDLQDLVHMADMNGSTKNGTFGVYRPHQKIRSYYPSLPGADIS